MKKNKEPKSLLTDEGVKPENIKANITAHISIRLPLNLVKELKKLALNEEYEGRYQVLIRDVLQGYAEKSRGKKKASA